MKVFVDFEFVERGADSPIVPVSVGLVRDTGRPEDELYLINAEALSAVTSHPWTGAHVVPSLPIKDSFHIFDWDPEHPDRDYVVGSKDLFAIHVREFLQATPNLQLWGDMPHYDQVVLTQLFGRMNELPTGIPMRTNDIRQLADMLPDVALPPAPAIPHHALWGARWARDSFHVLLDALGEASLELAATFDDPPAAESNEVEGEQL